MTDYLNFSQISCPNVFSVKKRRNLKPKTIVITT